MQLLEHFKELTLHPKNAEELKGLILQLAVHGKLTRQWRKENGDVEPASVLLEKINEEKERLIKEKKIKKEKPLSNIEEAETPYSLPNSWEWCKLGHSGYTQTGSTPPKNDPTNYGDYIPFIGPGDISNHWMKYPVEGLSEKGIGVGRLIPKGSIMMVCIGGSIGKCNINEIDVSCNQQINTITPLIIPSDFIKTVCQAPFFQKEVWEKSSGSATPIINKGKWENIIIPLPPLEEQKAIVEVVNQLFAEVEQLEALTKERIKLKSDFVTSALNQLTQAAEQETASQWVFLQQQFGTFFTEKENIKKLREGILQLAVQGKLTRDWRALRIAEGTPIEHASILLEKIKAEKEQLIKDGKVKKEKPLPEISEEEIPYELPEGWVWSRLGDITTIKGGKRLPKGHVLTLENTGRVYIRVTDMKNGSIDDSNLHFISEEVFEQISNYIIEKEDLYLTIVGATIGKLGLVPEKFHRMNLTENAARIIKYQIDKELLYYFMVSFFVQNQFFDKTNQVGVPKLALNRVAKTLLPLPPLAEQNVIVQKVKALMGFCDRLEKEIEQNTQQLENLMKSCLREVFEN